MQSVKYLPCKDGEVVGPGAVTVAFMDIKSACKALQTQHKLEERYGCMQISEASQLINIFSRSRLLKTDFYDPTSGDCGPGSVSVCPPTPEEKGGGPGGGVSTPGAGTKLEHPRASQHYYRAHGAGQDREYGARQHPPARYQETDFRHRPRPGQYRSSSSFNQEGYVVKKFFFLGRSVIFIVFLSIRVRSSSSSSYRNNYGWKDGRQGRPGAEGSNYNSSDKCDPNRPVSNNKPVKGGVGGGSGSGLPLSLHKKKNRTRRPRSNSSSDSQQSGSNSRSSSSSSSRSSSSASGSSKSPSPSRNRLGHYLPHTELDKLCTIVVRNLPDRPTENALKDELSREYKKGGCVVRSVRIVDKRGGVQSGRSAIITFSDQADVSKALEDSRNKRIFGSLIDVEKYAARQDDR